MKKQPDKQERLFTVLASRYADAYGRELLRELEELSASGAPAPSPGLERRVRQGIRARKRRAMLRYSGVAAAACLLLVFAATGIWGRRYAASPAAPAPSAQETSSPQATAPGEIDPGPLGESAVAYEAIPLGFTPGEAFSVAGFEQDVSKSIYYLEHAWEDDVVLTLEYRKYAGVQDYSELEEFLVNGEYVHGAYRSEYSLLTFEKDDVVYTMTCKYDINTLITLSEAILF